MSVSESQKRLTFIRKQVSNIQDKLMLNFNSSSFWKYAKLIGAV